MMTSPHLTQDAFGPAFVPASLGVNLPLAARIIWAGKWLILGSSLALMLVAGYYGFAIATPRHSAQVLIAPADSARNQAEVLRSDAILGQVIAQLALADDPAFNRYLVPVAPYSLTRLRGQLRDYLLGQTSAPPDAAMIAAKTVQNLRAMITITPIAGSELLQIAVTTGDPAQAMRVTNQIAQSYLDAQTHAKQVQSDANQRWLSANLAQLRNDLARNDAQISALALPDAATIDSLRRQSNDTKTALENARAALQRLDPASQALADSANRRRLTGLISALQTAADQQARALAGQTAAITQAQQLQTIGEGLRRDIALFAAHLHDAQISASQIGPDAQIVNPAQSAQYIGPQKVLLIQIAGLVGAMVGLALVGLRYRLRAGFYDAAALQAATGLPVLSDAHNDDLAATQLRSALVLRAGGLAQVIVTTSAIAHEGRTTQAIALAQGLARLGKRVLLVDADLRRNGFAHRIAWPMNAAGLAQVIAGQASLFSARQGGLIDGVDVLGAGDAGGAAADLVMQAGLGAFFAQARQQYDVIVIDAPPVLPVPDACALAQHADAVIFAVRCGKTPAKAVGKALDKLAAAQVKVSGLTLTQFQGGSLT
jgi:polysaccharide biosynthesis transport protein